MNQPEEGSDRQPCTALPSVPDPAVEVEVPDTAVEEVIRGLAGGLREVDDMGTICLLHG